jgi:hypothetical protein
MKAKHTPGPWRIVGDTEVRAGGTIICDTLQFRVPHPAAQAFAAPDARLIAAAPDLLAALQALEWAVSGVDYIETEYADQVAQARAAIAKATTEE